MFRLLSRTTSAQDLHSSTLYGNETFYKAFMDDLRYAERCVYIESPFITTKRMEELLPILASLRSRNVGVTANTRHPLEHEGVYVDQANDAVAAMQALGITVLYTVKHHRKLAILDDVLWEGSLNILSQNDSCEIMRRSASPVLVSQMANFIGATKYI